MGKVVVILICFVSLAFASELDCLFGCGTDEHCCGQGECCVNVCLFCDADEYCCGNNECCKNICFLGCDDDEYCCGNEQCCSLTTIWYRLWYLWVAFSVLVVLSVTGCCLCCRYCCNNKKPNVIIYQQPVTTPCVPATSYKQFENEPI